MERERASDREEEEEEERLAGEGLFFPEEEKERIGEGRPTFVR
jgi:hypothetical protein